MPSVAVKLYSVYFKLVLKHKLQSQIQTLTKQQSQPQFQPSPYSSQFGITSRPDESTAPANPSFSASGDDGAAGGGGGGVATKDIHIDPLTSLSVRIFLPDSCLSKPHKTKAKKPNTPASRRSSCSGGSGGSDDGGHYTQAIPRRSSLDSCDSNQYQGYRPSATDRSQLRKLPIVLQFHGGAFVSGSNVSVANDFFCRRIAKLMDVIVIAVGYRLAPECRYPAAFEDGMKVLHWLGKQANLAECSKSFGGGGSGRAGDGRKAEVNWRIVDTFGAATVEPWLAAHGDPSR